MARVVVVGEPFAGPESSMRYTIALENCLSDREEGVNSCL